MVDPTPEIAPLGQGEVLLADPNPNSRERLCNLLQGRGFGVWVASTGLEAWALMQNPDAPRLTIIATDLPEISGTELCTRLRDQDGDYVYVILLGPDANKDERIAGMKAGADDFVDRLIDSEELGARIEAGQRVVQLNEELLATRAELHRLATHDGLTGALTREAAVETLKRELARGRRSNETLAVVLVQIDHFSEIEEEFGPTGADDVLVETVARIWTKLRCYDSIGRLERDKFLVVLPGCTLFDVTSVAERLRAEIADLPINTVSGRAPVTVSVGVAIHRSEFERPETLLQAADGALCAAQTRGTNRVMVLDMLSVAGPPQFN